MSYLWNLLTFKLEQYLGFHFCWLETSSWIDLEQGLQRSGPVSVISNTILIMKVSMGYVSIQQKECVYINRRMYTWYCLFIYVMIILKALHPFWGQNLCLLLIKSIYRVTVFRKFKETVQQYNSSTPSPVFQGSILLGRSFAFNEYSPNNSVSYIV